MRSRAKGARGRFCERSGWLDPSSLGIGLVGIAAMVAGIYVLTTSPLVTGQLDQLERIQEEGMARHAETSLQRDIQRHRKAEWDRVEHASAAERERVDREDQELEACEREIDERSQQLRAYATQLEQQVRELADDE